jgi:hypothetical protein
VKSFEQSYFVEENDPRPSPHLEVGDPNRDRREEYRTLFNGEPCYAPVLGLTMFTADREGVQEILVTVRDPDNNEIHPNVVSTPTRRESAESLIDIVAASRRVLVGQTPTQHLFEVGELSWRRARGDHYNDGSGTQMSVDMMLLQKLGVEWGDGVWNTKIDDYLAALHSLTLGDSRVGVTDDGKDIIEKVAMANILVQVPPWQKKFIPSRTPHYSNIRWVTPQQYRIMQDDKNLLPVFDKDAVELCIHGVCIATSRVALDDMERFLKSRAT